MNDIIINKLKKMTMKALKRNEVPIGCVIVKNDKIIAKAYNKKISTKDPMAHAEILAIKRACKKIGSWNLKECVLYVTLRPCKMCECVINESRIKKVNYIIDNNKIVNNNMIITKINNQILEKEYQTILSNFFKNKR